MWNFLAALIGSLAIGGAVAVGKARDAEYEIKQRQSSNNRAALKRQLEIDGKEEREIAKYVLDANGRTGEELDRATQELMEEYEEDLKYIYGDEWKKPPFFWSYCCTNSIEAWAPQQGYGDYVATLMLASKGKLPFFALFRGFHVGFGDGVDRSIRFVQCVERRLHEAGATNVFFVFVPENPCDKSPNPSLNGGYLEPYGLNFPEISRRLW